MVDGKQEKMNRKRSTILTSLGLFLVMALALGLSLGTISAATFSGSNDPKSSTGAEKDKEKDKKKDKKKVEKKSDDDDDDGDDDGDDNAQKKEKGDKEGKKAGNNPPTVSLTAEVVEGINATVETDPVPSAGDAADDPAIWVNPEDSEKSTIIGTNKQGGLAVYDLSGKQLQYLSDGLLDNVDLKDGFTLGGQKVSLVTAGNRKDNSIAIYRVNAQTRMLENVAARKITHGIQIYGSCMYRSPKSGKFYYFGTSKSGEVEQWELMEVAGGKVDAQKVRNIKVSSVTEGCVADDELGHFYLSEEAKGIWKFSAEPDGGTAGNLIAKVGDGHLFADVEGLAIAYGAEGKGYLLASSQGNHSFVVYRREGNNEFVKKFKVVPGKDVDGAEETDGIDVTTAKLGSAFPNGVFVAQDGFNDKGNQNFKLVPLEAIFKP